MDWVASHPPSLGSFKLEIMKGHTAITEAILSLIVPISFCQVSHPTFKNPPLKSITCQIIFQPKWFETETESRFKRQLRN